MTLIIAGGLNIVLQSQRRYDPLCRAKGPGMKIAHISDLHFGAHDPVVVDALAAHLIEAGPHLVIASGDITQSATEAEFAAARAFFDALPMEVFVIPGNHDLPGMDLTRFINPFKRYKQPSD